MIKKISIGVDPGSSGAMCVIIDYETGRTEMHVHRFKKMTEKEVAECFKPYKGLSGKEGIFCVLERVHSFPGNGASSTFKFGENYGFIQGVLYSYSIPFSLDTPQTWMKTYGMKKNKNESGTQWKNRLKARAQQLFPEWKITNDMSDSMLIAQYCKKHKGNV